MLCKAGLQPPPPLPPLWLRLIINPSTPSSPATYIIMHYSTRYIIRSWLILWEHGHALTVSLATFSLGSDWRLIRPVSWPVFCLCFFLFFSSSPPPSFISFPSFTHFFVANSFKTSVYKKPIHIFFNKNNIFYILKNKTAGVECIPSKLTRR